MKGIIFAEFLDLVEDKFGLDVVDKMLQQSSDTGVYTSVGSYDHKALVRMIVELSHITGISTDELQRVYGASVFRSLYQTLPDSANLNHIKGCFAFLHHVEEYIHVEVKKLYPEANPPQFEFINQSEGCMTFDYSSARCLGQVCLGLIEGCAAFFDEAVHIGMEPQVEDHSRVRFTITMLEN